MRFSAFVNTFPEKNLTIILEKTVAEQKSAAERNSNTDL
jgi:hypothetical protein